jgi:hypothetical protein
LDHYVNEELADATEVPLSVIGYRGDDKCLENGKVLFRPDDWDRDHFPHVLTEA